MIVILGVTAAVLVVGTGFTTTREILDWQRRAVDQLESQARVVGANSGAALMFDDPRAATETLATLKAAPDVRYGAVYDANGVRFATYGDLDHGPARVDPARPGFRHGGFGYSHIILTSPVEFQGRRLGTVYLDSELKRVYADLTANLAALFLVTFAAFGLTVMLVPRLLVTVISPLSDLARVMENVTGARDYSLRATPASRDEIGALARSFNAMLDVVQDRDTKLAEHRAQLEETVRERTIQLTEANASLERELAERRTAELELAAHDAMLKAVAHGASDLLGVLNVDEDAISKVLELIGRTLAVGHVHLCAIITDKAGHLRSRVHQEWRRPGLISLKGDPALDNLDITELLPNLSISCLTADPIVLALDQFPAELRAPFEKAGVKSMLFVPVVAEGELWGGLWFMDSDKARRSWTWAETDSLATLAGMIGLSVRRARSVQALADADRIVQNSPTVLYRFTAAPPYRLTYLSSNIRRYGLDPGAYETLGDLVEDAVHPADRGLVAGTLARVVAADAVPITTEFRASTPERKTLWVENLNTPVRDREGRLVEVEGILTDITERKAAEEAITLLARTDSLTGLANRVTFTERLHQAFASTSRGAPPFAVLYLDLDHFKDVNDTLGHPVGDLLLKETAERLKSRVRESDLVARFGGDEFAILQSDIANPADAGVLGAAIVSVLAKPYLIQGAELHVTASVGIAPFTPDVAGPDAMLAQADLALYRAKADGRNQYRFHSADLDHQVNERVSVARDLRKAMESNDLQLLYQPQVALTSGEIIGMEALVRWPHPSRGLLRPSDFLPTIEGADVIDDFGRWVLDHACAQMARWVRTGVAPPVMAVNVALHQMKRGPAFADDVIATLRRHKLKPGDLELNVTESMLAGVTQAQNDVLHRLADVGVRLAVRDIGGPYSTFDYLRAFQVAKVKIARRDIEAANEDDARAVTLRAIVGAVRHLGMDVVAEGVQADDERALLVARGRSAQGPDARFSEPLPAIGATELLRGHKASRPAPGPAPARKPARRARASTPRKKEEVGET